VKELSRNRDHLLLESCTKKRHAVVQRRRERGEIPPNVERPFGLEIGPNPYLAEAFDKPLALLSENRRDRPGFQLSRTLFEQRNGHPLKRRATAAVQK